MAIDFSGEKGLKKLKEVAFPEFREINGKIDQLLTAVTIMSNDIRNTNKRLDDTNNNLSDFKEAVRQGFQEVNVRI
jgi:hypothetical protein